MHDPQTAVQSSGFRLDRPLQTAAAQAFDVSPPGSLANAAYVGPDFGRSARFGRVIFTFNPQF